MIADRFTFDRTDTSFRIIPIKIKESYDCMKCLINNVSFAFSLKVYESVSVHKDFQCRYLV